MIAPLPSQTDNKHDGFPGVKTLWRRLPRLHDIASTWKLLHPCSPLALETYG